MPKLHDEDDIRHTRLFELLRQKNQADTTVARVREFDISSVTADDVLNFQQTAMRSLQARH